MHQQAYTKIVLPALQLQHGGIYGLHPWFFPHSMITTPSTLQLEGAGEPGTWWPGMKGQASDVDFSAGGAHLAPQAHLFSGDSRKCVVHGLTLHFLV